MTPRYIVAIDQGTTSTRCLLIDRSGAVVSAAQQEHRQLYPQPGWVEHDPREIIARADAVVREALAVAGATAGDVAAVGIANQRETTVVWDRATGAPLYNAIVWQDTRTAGLVADLAREGRQDRFRSVTGLPLATYFSGPKARWVLDTVPSARELAERGQALFGTVDTFLTWWLTGGPDGGVHVTDVTNASRTLLMNLRTLDWDDDILQVLGIPRAMLPRVRCSSEVVGTATGALAGVPIAGLLGDQQAAMLGQVCVDAGAAKNTYGTGCFLLYNTGHEPVSSTSGLLTTVCYRLAGQPAVYALEGSIAIAGALVQWLRDNLGLIASAPEVEQLANSVSDNGGVYIVPAFSGLFAPHWRGDARGIIAGLTRYVTKGHLARAALEATAYQTREVVEAMARDAGTPLGELKVDGGMVGNETLMQFQADILGVPVVRPVIAETTALGAAFAAGLAVGFWSGPDELRAIWREGRRWQPNMDEPTRARLYRGWQRAVERSLGWIEG